MLLHNTNRLLKLLCTNPSTSEGFTVVLLHTGDDTKVKRSFRQLCAPGDGSVKLGTCGTCRVKTLL
jgi:hypothetical protein